MTEEQGAGTPAGCAAVSAGHGAGLTQAEAEQRLEAHGANTIPHAEPVSLARRVLRQLQSPLIYILLLALAFDLVVWVLDGADQVPGEAVAIAAVVLLNALLGLLQERRAGQALAHLRQLSAPNAWVMRDGRLVRRPSRELVPGDVVRLEAGERVPADGELVEGRGVVVDESVLTGESVPVDKPLGGELRSGTLLVRGQGWFTVRRTGALSTMGELAGMLGGSAPDETPLERRMRVLGKQVAFGVGGLALGLIVAGAFVEGVSRLQAVAVFAASLAVAAVPEGLPAVVALTMALGVQRMARRKAVMRRLSAVETLGSVTVIATDKTGTLTENRMTVRGLDALQHEEALRAMVLANDAHEASGAGDPLELALLEYARSHGVDSAAEHARYRRVEERPFDSEWSFMRVTVQTDGARVSYFKGSPEAILPRTSLAAAERAEWMRRAEQAARQGHRVLALARAPGNRERGLELLGLVMLWDPPRPGVAEAIARVRAAGVRVLMLTGDHPATAAAVATAVGLPAEQVITGAEIDALNTEQLAAALGGSPVFARVSPQHKLRLVEALSRRGEVVAMTGDGVNDAPALERADVGIAMGRRGSDVAREVADMVLLDDDFSTIVAAIEEGRGIHDNLQKFLRFTFSTNVALVIVVVAGVIGSHLLGLRAEAGMLIVPLTAMQLLWINVFGDGPVALALAMDTNPDAMKRPPRPPRAALLERGSLRFILGVGAIEASAGLAMLLLLPRLGYDLVVTSTAAFLVMSIGKLVSAYPARGAAGTSSVNGWLKAGVVLAVCVQLAAPFTPWLARLLGLEPIDGPVLGIVVASVILILAGAEMVNRVVQRGGGRRGAPHAPGPARLERLEAHDASV
jgi:Ca2+-transporting ATPase